MFKDNVIKFGYGTVLVYSSEMFRKVVLQYIEPPKPVGKLIDQDVKDIAILDEITFKYADDMYEFYKELKKVTPENAVVEFRDYTFDFTNYNAKSLEIVLRGFKRAVFGSQLHLAC